MRLRLLAPRYWLTWAGLGLLRLLAFLPFPAIVHIGRGLGTVLRWVTVGFANTARRNLELCMPELSAQARERLLREHFASLGVALLEIPFAWWARPERFAKLLHMEGAEHLRAALARGRGAIVLTAHFTSMELAGRALITVAPAGFLYRPPKNEVIAYAFERFRARYGAYGIPRDDIRAFVSALRRNECVWYAPDQSYRKKGAEMVPLFGIPAASNTLTSRFARMTGAPVLPYFFYRLPGTEGYRGVIHPPLEDFPSDCPVEDTARFYRMIEAQVQLVPEQYLWIHRRFKGLSADYPDYYGRQAPRHTTP
ncbi:MAG: lipid A biosynthesis lauroyl acyltransferase [Gammaproteobacteria bacterium]|nr:lipid A biosynthesis lauroyl acyltransferase [Gammaproteobacteria bacterium]